MKKELLATLLAKGVSLKVVEGNLKVNAPKGTLTKELIEKIKENKAYLISKLVVNVEIPKAAIAEKYASTPTQYFMWFTHEFLGGNRAYNITSTLLLKGELNITVLETTFKKVIQRHESLRTNFKKDGEKIYQHIRKEDEFEFTELDINYLDVNFLEDLLDVIDALEIAKEEDVLAQDGISSNVKGTQLGQDLDTQITTFYTGDKLTLLRSVNNTARVDIDSDSSYTVIFIQDGVSKVVTINGGEGSTIRITQDN